MVVPDDALSGLDVRVFNRTLTQPFALRDSDGVEAVAADGALAAHLGSTGDPVIDANHLVADLSVLYFDDPPDQRAATFVLPENRPIDSRFLDALLGALSPTRQPHPSADDTVNGLHTVPVVGTRGEAKGSDAPLTRSLEPKPSNDLSSFARRLGTTDEELAAYRTIGRRAEPAARRVRTAGARRRCQRALGPAALVLPRRRRRRGARRARQDRRAAEADDQLHRPGRSGVAHLQARHRLSGHGRPVPARRTSSSSRATRTATFLSR